MVRRALAEAALQHGGVDYTRVERDARETGRELLSEGFATVLDELALQSHFDSFARGVIELRRGLYFGGIIALGFTISVGSMEFARAR